MTEPTMTTPRRFPILLGRRTRWLLVVFGVRSQDDAFVDVDEHGFHARFGFAEARSTWANVERWRIEGPWRWITAVGIRRSVRHGDFTFAGSPRGGVRLDFREPVPYWLFRMPALHVGVEDLEGFASWVAAQGIPGVDARSVAAADSAGARA